MNSLKCKLTSLLEIIPQGEHIIFADYPVYFNIGDLLIFQGSENFFRDNNIVVDDRFSLKEKSQLSKKAVGDRTIVLQGGGNFGDLYPWHQSFREEIVRQFPDNKIVLLPQTIHFYDNEKAKESAAIFRRHKKLHICVRDEKSYKFAVDFLSDKVYLLPDMAHWLYGSSPFKPATPGAAKGTLWLIRGDKEQPEASHVSEVPVPGGDFQGDWNDLQKFSAPFLEQWSSKFHRVAGMAPVRIVRPWKMYLPMVRSIIEANVNFFSRYERVVTSRLHGHILGALLDKEIVLIDNSYGKNSGYYECWTKALPNVVLSASGA
ncbi:polysaccharide pyruvyl transferase family protein [Paraburkholderia sediminicola]|uniref:polysaccharide pyruvyl transferase family protein n=1 Tax=Paraburkholderia sediminicola TaxID=458836 RepID=UPI0038BB6A0D